MVLEWKDSLGLDSGWFKRNISSQRSNNEQVTSSLVPQVPLQLGHFVPSPLPSSLKKKNFFFLILSDSTSHHVEALWFCLRWNCTGRGQQQSSYCQTRETFQSTTAWPLSSTELLNTHSLHRSLECINTVSSSTSPLSLYAPFSPLYELPFLCPHHFADKGLYSQSYGLSSGHVWT